VIYRMTFASEPPSQRFPISDAQGGDGSAVPKHRESAVAALDPFVYEDMRWCVNCGGEQRFIPLIETEFGRIGFCLGCGEEKVQRFTRSIGEAA
jgi:hypothetical protein